MHAKEVPNHQTIQMKVGEKFINGSADPQRAVHHVNINKPTEENFRNRFHAG
jgi:hypothetical protein